MVGAGLLYLALPRTVAAVLMLPGDPVIVRLQERQAVEPAALEILIRSRRRALAWVRSGRALTDLGLARLVLARAAADGGDDGGFDRGEAGAALAALEAGLRLAPANAHAWARLAYARLVVDGPSPALARALAMSFRAAPYAPRLVLVRVELALRAWPFLTTPERLPAGDEMRRAWRHHAAALVELARHSGRADVVGAALAGDRAARAELERRLDQQPLGADGG